MNPRNYFLFSGKLFVLFSSCIWSLPAPSPVSSGWAAVGKGAAAMVGAGFGVGSSVWTCAREERRSLNLGWMRLGDTALFQHTTSTPNKKKKRLDSSPVRDE